jgi:hypothetical protein
MHLCNVEGARGAAARWVAKPLDPDRRIAGGYWRMLQVGGKAMNKDMDF